MKSSRWPIITCFLFLLFAVNASAQTKGITGAEASDHDSQQHQVKASSTLPELLPKRPECGVLLPARGEAQDLARLVAQRAKGMTALSRDYSVRLRAGAKDSEEPAHKNRRA